MTAEQIEVTRSEIEAIDSICHGIVVRGGDEDACCKPATAIVYDEEGASIWPACTWHAHRYGGAMSLAQIREALTRGSTTIEREF